MKSLTMTLHPVPAGGTGRSASEGASVQGAALQAEAAVPGTDVQMGAAQGTAVQEGTVQEAAALWYGDEVVAYREAADSLHTQRQAAGRSEAGSGEAGTQPHTAGAATVQTHRTNDATAAHRSGTTERQGHASETAGAGARHADHSADARPVAPPAPSVGSRPGRGSEASAPAGTGRTALRTQAAATEARDRENPGGRCRYGISLCRNPRRRSKLGGTRNGLRRNSLRCFKANPRNLLPDRKYA